ncbi:glycosyltransferase [Maridesulfovibrio sp.]|uniref:glycosyltransferase n=1 Tax=Maridesulfovibrio sp. TaxID=2795000 RepID=UPI003BA84709
MNKASQIIFSKLSTSHNLKGKNIFIYTGDDTLEWLYKHVNNFSSAGVACCGNVSTVPDQKIQMFPTGLRKHNFLLPQGAAAYLNEKKIREIYILPDAGKPDWLALLSWFRKGIRQYFVVNFETMQRVNVAKELIRKLPLGLHFLTKNLPYPIHSFCYNKIGKPLYNYACRMLPDDDLISKEKNGTLSLAQDIASSNDKSVAREDVKFKDIKIVQYIGGLGPGGAERQLCNVSRSLIKTGLALDVLCTYELNGRSAHYCDLLSSCGVSSSMAGDSSFKRLAESMSIHRNVGKTIFLPHVPTRIASQVYSLYGELIERRPQILHCWLDQPNIMGGLAGYLAEVPVILLSTRNLNPSWFPRFNEPYFKEWYNVFSQSERFVWLANSNAGALDYAKWLNVDPGLFRVIRNGVDFEHIHADTQAAELFRSEEGISVDAPMVLGAFRLDDEKRPLDFLETIRKVKQEIPDVVACIAGVGEMDAEVAKKVDRMGLGDTVRLLGRRVDIYRIMMSSNVLLLTSKFEGTPNVLLEAQYLKVPVVATKAGGSPEAMIHEKTGFVCDIGDIDTMAQSVVTILKNDQLAKSMGHAGHTFVSEQYSLDGMLKSIKSLYEELIEKSKQSL